MNRLRMFVSSLLASPLHGHEDLKGFLESLRSTARLPALGAAVVVEGKLECVEVAGFRKRGEDQPVTGGDKWHIGSCTMNYCVVWLAPARRFAAIAVSNGGSRKATKACDEIAGELIRRYLPAVPTSPQARGSRYR